jgi:hypothetical protein
MVAVVSYTGGIVTYDVHSCQELGRIAPSNSLNDEVRAGSRLVYSQSQKSFFIVLNESAIKLDAMTGHIEKYFSSLSGECRGGVPGQKIDIHNIVVSLIPLAAELRRGLHCKRLSR